MANKSPVAIFLAASAILASSSLSIDIAHSGEEEMGGLKEWSSDQPIEAESKLDEEALKAKKKAEEEDYCVPIGEGENCW